MDRESLEDACVAAWSVPRAWARASLGEQLRALRRDRDISQRHLAEASGVAQSAISRMEAGDDARWGIWKRLFEAMGYDAVVLPRANSEDTEGMIQDEIQQRRDREEFGRLSRWD